MSDHALALPEPFRHAPWTGNPHVQTLAGKFLRPEPPLSMTRERWDTPDDDFVDLDFLPDPGGPVVLVLHGLEGHTRRRYMLNLFRVLGERGLAAVGLNFRACSGEPNRRARAYHSGETGDLAAVLHRLRERYPGRPLGAVGFSLGGNVLLKYLGEDPVPPPGAETRVLPDAAVAISVPYDLAAGADLLARTVAGRFYNRYFLRSLLEKVRLKAHLLTDTVDLDALEQVRTLRAFDDLLTAPVHGFRDAEHYYRESSSDQYLEGITTPVLLLHAEDDPFLPPECIPRGVMEANPHLHPAITARGGHVGFLGGSLRSPRFWSEEATAAFLERALTGGG